MEEVMKVYLSKNLLVELRTKYLSKLQLIEGLESVDALREKLEYEVIVTLINRQLTKIPKEEKKKEYLQVYYQENKPKMNERSKEQSRKAREKSKLYDEIIRNGKIN